MNIIKSIIILIPALSVPYIWSLSLPNMFPKLLSTINALIGVNIIFNTVMAVFSASSLTPSISFAPIAHTIDVIIYINNIPHYHVYYPFAWFI